jgi:hypothetical protein
MKKRKLTILAAIIAIVAYLSSCTNPNFLNEQFPEVSNMSTDLLIDGQIAAPVVNTTFSLNNFIPNVKDSSMWLEIDQNNLIHLRMLMKDAFKIGVRDIFPAPIPLPGTIPADSIKKNTDTISMPALDKLQGHLFFDNPKIKIIFHNSMPIQLFFRIDTLSFLSNNSSGILKQNIRHYIDAGPGLSKYKTSELLLDKNSPGFANFPLMFTPVPQDVFLRLTLGTETSQTYSGTDHDTLKADVDLDFPLEMHLDNLAMNDTTNFSIDSSNNISEIKFKLFLTNEFPLGGKIKITFYDTTADGKINNKILDLFPGNGLDFKSSITNSSGLTTASTTTSIIVDLTKEKIDSLKNLHASKIYINAVLNSYNSNVPQTVKLLSTYKLGIKLGVKISYSANIQ